MAYFLGLVTLPFLFFLTVKLGILREFTQGYLEAKCDRNRCVKCNRFSSCVGQFFDTVDNTSVTLYYCRFCKPRLNPIP